MRAGAALGVAVVTCMANAGTAIASTPSDGIADSQAIPVVSNSASGPIVGSKGALVPMTDQMAAAAAAKSRLSQTAIGDALRAARRTSVNTASPNLTCNPSQGCTIPSAFNLALTQQTQQESTWCGPATVHESLAQISGATQLTQAQAANELGTDSHGSSGTDWYNGTGPTGYPVVDVMNANIPSSFPRYAALGVGSVTSSVIDSYETNLVYDTYYYGEPVIADVWLTSSSAYLLAGEPQPTIDVFHWFNIRGYSGWGATTNYEDSAWSPTGSASATAVLTMMSGRGYVF